VDVYLIDGTYELFRHYYALPSARDSDGREVGAVRGVIASVLGMIQQGATHLAVATDHVIESFRNQLWPGYKTGEGIDPDLLAQFQLLEDALSAMGIATWPMVEFEADDALASAAAAAARDTRVGRVIICTPDKDLAQCVTGTRVVQMNRRTRSIRDEAECSRSLECCRRLSPITWLSWAMRRMATPACRVGARNLPLLSWPGMAISSRSRRTGAHGM
jgi:5'-3' exonuclease